LYKRTRRRLRTIDEVKNTFLGSEYLLTTEKDIPRPKKKKKEEIITLIKRKNILSRYYQDTIYL
jgi:hypothetical protein